jgi:DNA-binding transcriptional MerR regulator
MSSEGELRIGEVAKLAGTTPRTIRYYEEIGLLPVPGAREPGGLRNYAASDVDRLTELLRL